MYFPFKLSLDPNCFCLFLFEDSEAVPRFQERSRLATNHEKRSGPAENHEKGGKSKFGYIEDYEKG